MAFLCLNLLIVIAVGLHAVNCSSAIIKAADKDAVPKELCCADACENKFGQNSKPKGESWFACHRGCRFFSLIELLADGQPETSIRSSCQTACDDAYNQTLDKSCKHGCAHQTLIRPRKNEEEVVSSLQRIMAGPNSWAPSFAFRIGFVRTQQETATPSIVKSRHQPFETDEADPLSGSSLKMIKEFFSGFLDRLSPQAIWSSRTSYSYLLGRNNDGKDKVMFLPHLTETLPTTTARHEPHPTPAGQSTIKSTTSLAIQRVSNSSPRRTIIGRAGKRRKNEKIRLEKLEKLEKEVDSTKSPTVQAKMLKTEVNVEETSNSDHDEQTNSSSIWKCLKPGKERVPWVFCVLASLLILLSCGMCGSTWFFTRQLTKSEQDLRRRGYIRLDRDDPEVAKLLSDMDDLSEDEDVYMLPADGQKGSPPPSYEESLINCEILIPTKARLFTNDPLLV